MIRMIKYETNNRLRVYLMKMFWQYKYKQINITVKPTENVETQNVNWSE